MMLGSTDRNSMSELKSSQSIQNKEFTIPLSSENDIFEILTSMNTSKDTGFDKIPAERVQLSAPNITRCLTMLVNQSISQGVFPKIASVIPVFKIEDPLDKGIYKNYRPMKA